MFHQHPLLPLDAVNMTLFPTAPPSASPAMDREMCDSHFFLVSPDLFFCSLFIPFYGYNQHLTLFQHNQIVHNFLSNASKGKDIIRPSSCVPI